MHYRKHHPDRVKKDRNTLTARIYFMAMCHIHIIGGNKERDNRSLFKRERSVMWLRSVRPREDEWCQESGCGTAVHFALPSYSVLVLLNKTQMEHMNSLIFRSPTSLTMTSPQLLNVYREMTPV